MKNSVSKLALDECYSEKTQKVFANYEVTVDDANYSYQFIFEMLKNFIQLIFISLYLRSLYLKIYLEEVLLSWVLK